ncbi:MAG TPA: hypothetical protein VFU19_11475 [Iamia sp.]|nr:hypothetical protein [Iamia sp.]
MSDIAWGTFPDWVAAVGTVGALGATIAVLWSEIRQRREADKDARWAQARRVSYQVHATATYEVEPGPDGTMVANLEKVVAYTVTATMTNSSVEPITDVRAVVMGPMGVLKMTDYGVIHPGQQGMVGTISLAWNGGPPFGFTGHLRFTDARGHRWQRSSDSTLKEVLDPGAEDPSR